MKKNDIVTLEITGLTSEGNGVARYDGMAVFVPFAAVGDKIEARIVKVNKTFAFAKIEKINIPSADRIDNDCPAFGKCGGCAFRHINYRAELNAKEGFVKDAFERLGGFCFGEDFEFLPIMGAENDSRYRNKLQMPVGKDNNGRIVCGFYAGRSHRIIPASDCLLQNSAFAEIVGFIAEKAEKYGISVYNEEKHEGVLRHIYLRRGNATGEICVTLVARRKVPEFTKLAREIAGKFSEVTGVVLNINPEKTNVILGEREEVLFGKAWISDVMSGVRVEISPKSFYQVNTPMAEKLYGIAADFADFGENETVLDLYCGIGTVGLSMAQKTGKLIGAEIVPEAVENAVKNARLNGVSNAEYICADAGKAAAELEKRGLRPDVILLDPPRKGCDETTLASCAAMKPEKIVMISCNPATAARDCKRLRELGYKPVKLKAVDLFPRTVHVECVVSMSRKAE